MQAEQQQQQARDDAGAKLTHETGLQLTEIDRDGTLSDVDVFILNEGLGARYCLRWALLFRAAIRRAIGSNDAALFDCDSADALYAPLSARVALERALCLVDCGRFTEALRYLDRAVNVRVRYIFKVLFIILKGYLFFC